MISKTKVVVSNGDVLTAQIRDTNASHYLGRLNSDQAPTGSSITLATGVSVTAKNNDWINLQTKPDAYLFTGSTWVQFGGGGGGVTSYSALTEKPAIDNHTLMSGNNTSSDLGLQTKLSTVQLEAVNSGITSDDVAQIRTNENDITLLQEQVGYAVSELEGVL